MEELLNKIIEHKDSILRYQDKLSKEVNSFSEELEGEKYRHNQLLNEVADSANKLGHLYNKMKELISRRQNAIKQKQFDLCKNTSFDVSELMTATSRAESALASTNNSEFQATQESVHLPEVSRIVNPRKNFSDNLLEKDKIHFSRCKQEYDATSRQGLFEIRKAMPPPEAFKFYGVMSTKKLNLEQEECVTWISTTVDAIAFSTTLAKIVILRLSGDYICEHLATKNISMLKLLSSNQVIFGCTTGEVILLETDSKLEKILHNFGNLVTGIGLDSNNCYVVTACMKGVWALVHITEARIACESRSSDEICAIDLHPGNELVGIAGTKSIKLLKLLSNEIIWTFESLHNLEIKFINFLYQGNWMISCSGKSIQLFDLCSKENNDEATSEWRNTTNPSTYFSVRLHQSGAFGVCFGEDTLRFIQVYEKITKNYLYQLREIHCMKHCGRITMGEFLRGSNIFCYVTNDTVNFLNCNQ